MRIMLDTDSWVDVVFQRIISAHQNGNLKINTRCVIYEGEEHTSDDIIGVGCAKLHHRDQYHKIKGKKIALKRAIANVFDRYMEDKKRYEPFSKEERTHIWEEFHANFPHD